MIIVMRARLYAYNLAHIIIIINMYFRNNAYDNMQAKKPTKKKNAFKMRRKEEEAEAAATKQLKINLKCKNIWH